MVRLLLPCCLFWMVTSSYAQQPAGATSEATATEIIALSQKKWQWMADRLVDSLEVLFHPEAVFVHMGGTLTREQELEVIRTGRIHYKYAEIFEVSVRFLSPTTAVLLNRIRLDAVVGGNEVTNPFMVTEVYVRENNRWKLGTLAFTRLLER